MQHIYLSPHYDDIAFSVSSRIQAGGIVLDVFTISNYVENEKCLDGNLTVSEIRKNEEMNFVKHNKLKYKIMKLQDSGIDGSPFSRYHKIPINKKLEKELLKTIHGLNLKNKIDTIFCPLGVGKHLDHLQLFLIIQKHYKELKKFFNVVFYAEIPYIFYQNNLENRVNFLKHWLRINHIRSHRHTLTEAEVMLKIKQLKIYKSQFPNTSSKVIFDRISDLNAKVVEIMYY